MHKLTGTKQTPEHIQKRLATAREKNFGWTDERRKRFSENNPMKNIEIKNKMVKSKILSPYTPRGKKHHNWKEGISGEQSRIRKSLEYVLWRNEVWRRDNWTCRVCNIHCQKGNIVAHHLKKFADFPELRFITENGITLCRKCHATVENPKRISHT